MKNRSEKLAAIMLILLCTWVQSCGQSQSNASCEPADSIAFQSGELQAAFRGNAICQLPTDNLSGISLLVNNDTPEVNAFQSVGLNFEHIISGQTDSRNLFEPRFGQMVASQDTLDSVTLTRGIEDSLWGIGTEITYRVVPPYYIDFEFTATPSTVEPFQPHNYIVFFLASYMSGVENADGYHFRGIPAEGEPEQWVNSSSTPNYSASTFIAEGALQLEHEADSILDLHLDHEPWPRITQPYYCGQVAGGMVYQVMFDKLYDPLAGEEVRFSNFKLTPANPAWDFEYVIHNPQKGVPYTLRGRLVWKPFVDLDNCEAEYLYWIQ